MAKFLTYVVLLTVLFAGLSHAAVVDSAVLDLSWIDWKIKFDKHYETVREEEVARATWTRNLEFVEAHNELYRLGLNSFRVGLNARSDQEANSFRRQPLVELKPQLQYKTQSQPIRSPFSLGLAPSFDWRNFGKVNPVVNQGSLGESLAFDVADAVASFSAINEGTELSELSAQEVVDCCLPDPIYGAQVFTCIKNNGGLCANNTYHTGTGVKPCNNDSCKAAASPKHGGRNVEANNETALAEAVLITPVVVAVDASHTSFQLYEGGVYSDPSCSKTVLDHVLLVVGWGTTPNGVEYWICKNTWGVTWGEQGYINIARNKDNMCGIASMPIFPY
ncbi:cathepsin J-like [Diadema antillarum]|uniref:cathepsin J-like n=1 Tax=Diadema antillarum TaxID=105358 RepID=UPI003A8832F2